MINIEGKFIVDVNCGGRHFWFDKKNPNVLFIDIRYRPKGFFKERPNFSIEPDIVGDFRDLKLPSDRFELVVWDPPHIIRKTEERCPITKKYGVLNPKTWARDLKSEFEECWRILKSHGILIFKWSESDKKLKEILDLFPIQPLFGHTTGSRSQTHWLCFMKI
jgi:hypothetical protein